MENKFFDRVRYNLNKLSEKMNVFPELRENVTTVDEIIANISRPVLIMVMGEFSTGKSTFINALVKKDIATVGARPTTAVITKLSYGTQDKIEVVFLDGTKKTVNPDEFSKLTAEVSKHEYDDLRATIAYVSRTLPIDILKHMTIVDSPGLNSIKPIHAETTRKFMDKADTVIWVFSADTPAKQTEIDALKKLNPRLSPVVVLNKIDTVDEEEGESVESIIADIDRKLRNNKIQAQKFIGLSAKLAFEGVSKHNSKLLAASNIDKFYDVVNDVIVPNRENYKQNSLFDEIAYLVNVLSVAIENISTKNAFMCEENFSEYEKTARNLKELGNCLKSLFKVFEEHVHKNTSPSEEFLLGIFYFGQIVSSGNTQTNYSEALAHFHKAAELGHHNAATLIGIMYNMGIGVQQDYFEAFAWFQKAAEGGNAEALSCIGTLYYKGNGVKQDYAKAVEFYTKAAEMGDLMAMNDLAYMYSEGLGVSKNLNKARALIKKAAEAGDSEAMMTLGELSQSEEEAAKWVWKATEAGHAEAMYILSSMYAQGRGFPKDTQKAMYWLKKSATHGNANAVCALGYLYLTGEDGYTQNYQEALKWLRKAVEMGDKKAPCWLGYMYYEGEGVLRDYSEAFKWFKKAADLGDERVFLYLGIMYREGRGVTRDYFEAFKWFKKAAEADYKIAFWWVGYMYHEGEGTTRDYFEASRWFKKAADVDDEKAFFWLGRMYREGEGTTRDYSEAFKWFKKAADAGDIESFYLLGLMYYEGEGTTRDYFEAFKWFKKAADNGDGCSMGFLARMYRYGNGVTQNYFMALTWYQNAIDAGFDSAREERAEFERERQRALTASSSSNILEDNSNTAMVVGAGIGLFVAGPLGAIAGGWLGKKLFGK